MATVAVKPIVLRNFKFTVAADDYSQHVNSVTLTPSSSDVTWKGGTPAATFTFPTTPTWAAELQYAQDWETVNSLSRYLFAKQGSTVAATFEPEAGGTKWAVNLVIRAGSIGGAIDSTATATVSLGVSGQPVPTYAQANTFA